MNQANGWTSNDGVKLINALADFNKDNNGHAGDQCWIVSRTGGLIALAGHLAAKLPPKQLLIDDQKMYIENEMNFYHRMPLNARVGLAILSLNTSEGKWFLSTAPQVSGLPVLLMRRLSHACDLLSLSEAGKIPKNIGFNLAALIKSFHFNCPLVEASEAIKTVDFEIKDYELYLTKFKSTPFYAENTKESSCLIDMVESVKAMAQLQLLERAQQKLFRDIHADLHTENIYYTNNALLLVDPMPKSIRRRVDPLTDVARVYLELLRLNIYDQGREFLDEYNCHWEKHKKIICYLICRSIIADIVSIYRQDMARPCRRAYIITNNIVLHIKHLYSFEG